MKLIDADVLKKEIHRYALDVYGVNLENSKEFAGDSTGENYCEGFYEATELIDYLPTVEVVRCCDCRHFRYNLTPDGYLLDGVAEAECTLFHVEMDYIDYCSYGERRSDD